eukprot:1423785-Prymnesium_polylepis.4
MQQQKVRLQTVAIVAPCLDANQCAPQGAPLRPKQLETDVQLVVDHSPRSGIVCRNPLTQHGVLFHVGRDVLHKATPTVGQVGRAQRCVAPNDANESCAQRCDGQRTTQQEEERLAVCKALWAHGAHAEHLQLARRHRR